MCVVHKQVCHPSIVSMLRRCQWLVKRKSHIQLIYRTAAAVGTAAALLRKATLLVFFCSIFHLFPHSSFCFLSPASLLLCKKISLATSVSFPLSIILFFYLCGLSAQTCLLAPQHHPLTSFLVWSYCSPSHPYSLILVLSLYVSQDRFNKMQLSAITLWGRPFDRSSS